MKTIFKTLILGVIAMAGFSSCGVYKNTTHYIVYTYADITQDTTEWKHALIEKEGQRFPAPNGAIFFYTSDGKGVTIQGGTIQIRNYKNEYVVNNSPKVKSRRELVARFRELESAKYHMEETIKEYPEREDFRDTYKSIVNEMKSINNEYYNRYGISIKSLKKRHYISNNI